MANLIYGVGVVGVKNLHTNRGGITKIDPVYRSWARMLERGYSDKFKDRRLSYKDVTVVEEWHFFPTFREWALDNKFDTTLELDKDLLVMGNKTYGPDTCAYIPKWLNQALNRTQKSKGPWPMGVTYKDPSNPVHTRLTKPYTVYLKIGSKMTYTGSFSDPFEAHAHWQVLKAEQIDGMVLKYMLEPSYQQHVANALHQRAEALRMDAEQGVESFIF